MREIININFVSSDAPNILIGASVHNETTHGRHLKHFKNTHNIYILIHNTDNDFAYYYDLPSHHNEIVTELNKHNLYKFSLFGGSFGSFISFYIAFHLPERVEKVFIHDFYLYSNYAYNLLDNKLCDLHFNLSNWFIPKTSNIPVLFLLCEWNFVSISDIKKLKSIFNNNIFFIIVKSHHSLLINETKKFKRTFIKYNGISYKNFWNKIYPLYINNKKLPLSFNLFPHNLALRIFLYICKKKGYKTKH